MKGGRGQWKSEAGIAEGGGKERIGGRQREAREKVQYASLKDEKGFENYGENSALFSPMIPMQEPSPFMR